jgi:hypothetical protein
VNWAGISRISGKRKIKTPTHSTKSDTQIPSQLWFPQNLLSLLKKRKCYFLVVIPPRNNTVGSFFLTWIKVMPRVCWTYEQSLLEEFGTQSRFRKSCPFGSPTWFSERTGPRAGGAHSPKLPGKLLLSPFLQKSWKRGLGV